MKTRQAMFSVCICFILCGPLLLFCLEKAGVHLPDDMTAKSAQYLSGGMSYVNVRSFLNFPSITSGEFQNATEKEIGNYIPAKADALLGNAAIQRCGIEASNTLFNWSCYPTYYGSNHIYIPAEGALASLPAAKNNWGGATDFFKSLNAYAQENENLKFIVYIVAGREYLPDANPAFSLTASPVTLDNLLKEVQRNIISPNLIIETNYYQYNLETFYENYYKSDLHWNIQGALAANEQIAKHLNSPYLEDYSIAELSSILFAGTESRQSLYDKHPHALPHYFQYAFHP